MNDMENLIYWEGNNMAGNDKKYDIENVEEIADSPIRGKKIIF